MFKGQIAGYDPGQNSKGDPTGNSGTQGKNFPDAKEKFIGICHSRVVSHK